MNEVAEIWKPIVGFESQYLISNLGNVFSMHIGRNMLCTPYTISGHTAVCLARKTIGVHLLVLNHFVGPCPVGYECRHKDGNAGNNVLTNLEWNTQSVNTQDRKWHKKPSNWKFTPDDVRAIRKRLKTGEPRLQIAKSYNVSRVSIDTIARGKSHKDVI